MILGWLNYTDLLCKGKETKRKAPIGAFIFRLAGVAGLGPAHLGVKDPCLSAWLHPKSNSFLLIYFPRARKNGSEPPLQSIWALFFADFENFFDQIANLPPIKW